MIEWSIAAFRASDSVGPIVVAAPSEVVAGPSSGAEDVWQVGPQPGSTRLVEGGATRAESVSRALAAVETEFVAIHDAARPLLTAALVEALVADLAAAPEAAGVIAAAPLTDTVKRAKQPARGSFRTDDVRKEPRAVVEATLDRSELWAAQTPQLFRTAVLREALAVDAASRDAATDEAMLIEAAGGTVLIHPTGPQNLKVTTPHDLAVAELLLAR